jgi:hypothetical protein
MYSIATAGANNRSAALYPSSQLTGIAGQTLNTLYYKRLSATGTMSGTPNFKVYMKEVSVSDFGSGALDWATEIATATLVYDSDPSASVGSNDGWKNFPMSTNFVYSGTQNLAVFTEYINTTASSSIGWAYEYQAPCITTSNNDTGKYSNNTSGTFSATLGSSNYRRPLIGFDFVVSCNAPNSLVNTNVGSTTADFSWVENAIQPQNGYEYYNTTSTTPPSPTETPTGTTANGVTTLSLSSLTSATTYYFWVRGNCGASDKSIWVGPLIYTTTCVPYLAPFNENFDGLALVTPYTDLPNCWEPQTGPDYWDVTNDILNAGNTYSPDVGDHTTGSSNYMWIDSSSDITANEMVSPLIDLSNLTAPYVGFWYLSQNTNNSILHSIALDVWDGTSWLNIVTQSSNFPTWVQVAGAVPSTVPTITKFRIHAIANPSGTTSDYFYNDLGVDDFFVIETPPCPLPNNQTVSNVTATEAVLGWTENGSATTWNIEYGVQGFTPGTGSTIVSGVTSNPYTLTSLMPATAYEYYVQSDCGATNGVSTWTGPFAFITECVEVDNFVENFDTTPTGSGNLPICWSKVGTSNNVYVNTGSNAPMSPANRLYMNISTTTTAFAVMPPVSNLQANTHRLRFKTYCTSANKVLSVGYFTTPGDETTYVEIEPFQLPSTALSSTQEFTVVPMNIPVGVNQLVFNLVAGATTTAYIDDVKWEVNSSCVEPSDLTASAITNNGATLGWTNGGPETMWDIEYGLSGFALGSGTMVNGITTNPHILSGLTSNTEYEFYVRGVCTGPENSSWSGPFLFKTQCDEVTEFTEDFEGYATGTANPLPDCWGEVNIGTGNSYITTGANAPMSPSNRLYMTANGATPTETCAVLPPVSNLQANTHRLKFKAYSSSGTDRFLSVGYMTDPSDINSFIQIQEVNIPGTTLATTLEFIIVPGILPTGVKHLAIKNPGHPSGTTIAYVDDVIWEAIPACPGPTFLSATNVLSTSAELSWTEMGSATLWNVEYGPVGYTQGTGGTLVSGVNTNPYSLTGLTPSTSYDYYVQADCGGTSGSSIWIGPFTFTTACTAFTAPYIENFDGLPLTSPYTDLPNCWETQIGPDYWDVTNDVTNTGHTYLPNIGDHTTGTSNYMWIDSSTDITANEMVSPLIDMSTLTNPSAGFWFASNNVDNTINHTIALDVWDGSAWLNIATETGNFTGWVKVVAVVPSTVPTTTKFRIYAIANPNGTSSDYYFNDLGVDDFFVEETPTAAPSCATNIVATPDTACGNEPTLITWDATPLSDGYYITIGTTAGGNDVLDNVDIGSAVSYSFSGSFNTTYYYTITPYNALGSATGCVEQSFVTFVTSCYCFPSGTSTASYIDDFSTTSASTNITNSSSGLSTDNYGDFTTLSTTLGSTQSFDFSVSIVGGTVGCAVWVDWDNDYSFDPSDMLYSTTSYGNGPFTGTITVPAATPAGNYRMRVMIDWNDSNPGDDDACSFGSGRGEVEDYTITVDNTLSSQEFDSNSFVAYPNPVNDVLNLSYSTEISSVKVINLLGQEVISKIVGNSSTQIDMSNLSAGAYIVNISVGDIIKTIKVIKK